MIVADRKNVLLRRKLYYNPKGLIKSFFHLVASGSRDIYLFLGNDLH